MHTSIHIWELNTVNSHLIQSFQSNHCAFTRCCLVHQQQLLLAVFSVSVSVSLHWRSCWATSILWREKLSSVSIHHINYVCFLYSTVHYINWTVVNFISTDINWNSFFSPKGKQKSQSDFMINSNCLFSRPLTDDLSHSPIFGSKCTEM